MWYQSRLAYVFISVCVCLYVYMLMTDLCLYVSVCPCRQLDYNNLTEVSKGWLYGLLTLQQLHLGHNAISRIRPDAWEFCQKLSEL